MQKSVLFSPVKYSSVEKALFLSLLFFVPFQTRLILFGEKPFLEWTGGFLYGTDLLFLGVLGAWLLTRPQFHVSRVDFFLAAFLTASAFSAFFAERPLFGFYTLLKLCEMAVLFYYVEHNVRRYRCTSMVRIVITSGMLQALLAISQFWLQSDLGLRHIEPGPLGAWIRGVANFFSDSGKFIRAYGTFPHPNVLAIFLLGAIGVLYWRFSSGLKHYRRDLRFTIYDLRLSFLLFWTASLLLLYAFLITFSRAVIGVGITGLIFFCLWLLWRNRSGRTEIVLAGILFLNSLFLIGLLWPEIKSRFQFSRREEAVEFRISSSESAWDMMRKYPFLGVGPGNYIPHIRELIKDAPRPSEAFGESATKQPSFGALRRSSDKTVKVFSGEPGAKRVGEQATEGRPRLNPADGLQPAHNLFLLVGSETGFLGLLTFSAFLFFTAKGFFTAQPEFRMPLLLFLFVMGAFSLVDHYFWTLQQGRLLWWLSWGIMAAYGKK